MDALEIEKAILAGYDWARARQHHRRALPSAARHGFGGWILINDRKSYKRPLATGRMGMWYQYIS